MIFKYDTSVFVQTKSKRGSWGSYIMRSGRWRADSTTINYYTCPDDHYIVAPYELMEWKE